VEEVTAAAQSLAEMAEVLQAAVAQFKLAEGIGGKTEAPKSGRPQLAMAGSSSGRHLGTPKLLHKN
jgi:hypothetical protein